METWLVALVGGAVGSLLTFALAVGGRVLAARREIDATDRFIRDRDEDLASRVSDRSVALERELTETTEQMNKKNLFYSGAHGVAFARLKERALHEYRDQERQARRDVALAHERESWPHAFWRRFRRRPFPTLTTPERAQGVLDTWRSSVTRHGDSPIEIIDPARRGLPQAAQEAIVALKNFV